MTTRATTELNGVQLVLCEKNHHGKPYTVIGLGDGVKVEVAATEDEVEWATNKAYKMARGGHVEYNGECDVFADVV